MSPTLSPTLLSSLSQFVAAQTGLHFPQERWGDLERGVVAAAPDFGFPDAESCAYGLLSAPLVRNQIERLASHLTVGETYFFREKHSMDALEQHILPELLNTSDNPAKQLRIWSAGCCTGEEPYSIAMLIDRLTPQLPQCNVTILATDINPQFLRRASAGIYGDWSFRETPSWIRDRYFKRGMNRQFQIQSSIRKRVDFSYLNLADDVYPSLTNNTNAMDLILCRNVLMYFTAERARQVVDGFYRSLVDGGWLIVSPVEASNRLLSQFTAVEFPGVVLYRKTTAAMSKATAPMYQAPIFNPEPEVASWVQPVAEVTGIALQDEMPVKAEPADLTTSAQDEQQEMPVLMARSCANQGKLAEAAAWCEKAISLDKLNPAYHYLHATIRQELGQGDTAIQSLKHALYLDPDFVLVHFTLGNLCLLQGQRREAERHFDNAQKLLHRYPPDDVLPEADGLTAGRLGEIIASLRLSLPRSRQ